MFYWFYVKYSIYIYAYRSGRYCEKVMQEKTEEERMAHEDI